MATAVDTEKTVEGLEQARSILKETAEYGKELAPKFDKIYFVACGAPNRLMLSMEYWLQQYAPSFEIRRYFPAEFMAQNPPRMDARTLVILGSKSGTTKETVAAAKFVKDLPCKSVGFTMTEELPLAKALDHTFLLGDTDETHTGMFMALQAFTGGLMAGKDGWPHLDKMVRSLEAMPEAMGATHLANDPRAKEEARIYKDDRIMYHVASGPMFNTAYVFGVCILMEMQWMHSFPFEAAEFFHGPFEIVDENTPLVLMLGEDASRPLMERVVKFCDKYTERVMVYDSKDFEMKGIDPEIRQFVAPLIIEAALYRFATRLSVWHNHDLDTRRYMWKTEY